MASFPISSASSLAIPVHGSATEQVFRTPVLFAIIASFCNFNECSFLHTINKRFTFENKHAMGAQLATKESLAFHKIMVYQRFLKLDTLTEVVRLCVRNGQTKLTGLDLSYSSIDDVQLGYLIAEFPLLKSLDLTRCLSLTDVWLRALTACPELTSLKLGHRPSLTDNRLREIATACPNLTSLALPGCSSLTDTGLSGLAAALTSLDLSSCRMITDNGLRVLGAACPGLTTVDLSGCYLLTPAGLINFAIACTDLTTLKLSDCCSLTDDELRQLAVACPNLNCLYLSRSCCDRLTNAGLEELATGCPHLAVLDLWGYMRGDAGDVGEFAAAHPGIHIIHESLS